MFVFALPLVQWFDNGKGEIDVRFLQDVLYEVGIIARSKTIHWLNHQLNPDGLPTVKASFFIEWWFYHKFPEQPKGLRTKILGTRLRMRQKARQRIAKKAELARAQNPAPRQPPVPEPRQQQLRPRAPAPA